MFDYTALDDETLVRQLSEPARTHVRNDKVDIIVAELLRRLESK